MARKLKRKQLSYKELERLAEAWSRDPDIARKMCIFLKQFGPSGSDSVNDFFKWVKREHGVSVECATWTDPDATLHMDYQAKFASEEDELAFTLRFS